MSQRTVSLSIVALVAAIVLVDATWLFRRALPAIPASHGLPVATSSSSREEVKEQIAILRSERDYAIDTAIGVAAAGLFFGGFALAFVILKPRDG